MLERIYKAQQLMDAACKTLGRQINIMEVCGTHTVAIFRNGIRTTLPKAIKLLSGPGCPVCVTDQSYIDIVLDLAQRDDCIIATYGDMIRVPGSNGSLETKRSVADVRVMLSSTDALAGQTTPIRPWYSLPSASRLPRRQRQLWLKKQPSKR